MTLSGILSDEFQTYFGVKHGYVMSSVLFNKHKDCVIRQRKGKSSYNGANIKLNEEYGAL